MANVRCPMCSKLNPPDSDACAFCGARLKPVKPPSGESFASQPAGEDPEEVPDWLRSLRSDEPGEQEEGAPQQGEPGEGADWLSRIRSRAQTEMSSPPEEGQGETPDWLSSLSGEPAPDQPSGDMEDWMSKLSGAQPGEADFSQPAAEAQGEQFSSEPGENFDWLGGLRDAETPAEPEKPSAEEPVEGSGFGLTGFLTSLEENPPGNEPPAAEKERAEPPSSPAAFSGDPLEGLPEWLGGEPPSGAQPAHEAGESGSGLPEWLQSLSEEPVSSSPAGQEDLPTWPEGGNVPAESKPGEEEPVEIPQWLGGEPAPEAAEDLSRQEDNIPSWLASFAESDAEQSEKAGSAVEWGGAPPDEAESISTGTGADLPPWLDEHELPQQSAAFSPDTFSAGQGLTDQADQEDLGELASAEEQQPAKQEDLPDWLAGFGAAGTIDRAEGSAGAETGGEGTAAQPPSPTPLFLDNEKAETAGGGDVPEWLRNFDTQATSEESVPSLIEPESPLESEPVFEGGQPFAVELPDWLSEDSSQASGEQSEQAAETTGEELPQADLPDWVKEMRPIETIIPGAAQMAETERKAEKSGPLAGMNGVLPAEELAARYSKPPVYTVKLRVTEKQRGQAAQFETILAQETQPLLIPPQGKNVQGLLVRIVVALLLIAALALPPLIGMEPLATPALYPAETQHMYDQIENDLQSGSPVLLAVDFEPGLYGEMRLASLPVIEHLISKNARLVIISTRPNGAALAQNLIASVADGHEEYDLAASTENLGYLPGDTISLLAFAGRPSFAAPGNLGGELAWQKSTLQGINSIRDFSQVIVLTDTAETGRAWVEQVQPQMGDVPLLMVTSAQAAPMMAPFVQSGQVNGMVAGQLGGVLYAQWARQESPVTGYLASYQIGIILAFGLTLLGGIISGGLALTQRGQKEGE